MKKMLLMGVSASIVCQAMAGSTTEKDKDKGTELKSSKVSPAANKEPCKDIDNRPWCVTNGSYCKEECKHNKRACACPAKNQQSKEVKAE